MVAIEILEAAEDGDIRALEKFGNSLVTESVSDNFGSNCLHYAARQGGVNVIRFLIKQMGFSGTKRSNIGATPAHDAAASGNLDTLQWLLSNTGCNVTDQDGTGATVLHLACRFHHSHVTEWLLEHGKADIEQRTASGGIPLHFAVVGADYEAVKLLLEEDRMSVNSQCVNGATPTYLAAQEGQSDIMQLLIQSYRGNTKIKAYDGMSCLHAAAQSGHLDCVRFLVEEEKCNTNDRDFDGATPLHYAASQGHASVIDWLMKVGGARVTLDNLGGSPLHNAAESNQTECIKTLINNGCSIDITDNNGLTAAELARKCYHSNSAELIETYKANIQRPVDADIEYLSSVQSPRPNSLLAPNSHNGYTPNSPNYQREELDGQFSYPSNQNYPSNQVVSAEVYPGNTQQTASYLKTAVIQSTPDFLSPVRPSSPLDHNSTGNQSSVAHWLSDETGETESVIARADSEEFLVGIPRKFSQDLIDSLPFDENFKKSESCSSLSSLSQPDESAPKKYDSNAQNIPKIGKLGKQEYLTDETDPSSTTNHTQGALTKNNLTKGKYQDQRSVTGGFSYIGPREIKSVKFQSGIGYDVDVRTGKLLNMENSAENIKADVTVNGDAKTEIRNSGITNGSIIQNGVNEREELNNNNGEVKTNGFVKPTAPNVTMNGTKQMHTTDATINTQNAPHRSEKKDIASRDVVNIEIINLSNSSPNEVNGNHIKNQTPASAFNEQSTPPTSDLRKNSTSAFSQPKLLPSAQVTQDAPLPINNIPTPPPPPNISVFTPPKLLTNEADDNTPPTGPVPPAPPPPPPIPQINGSGNQLAPTHSVNGTSMTEIKAKSASLPARPMSGFSADMIQSQRSTLSRITPNSASNTKAKPSNDFIAELKLATKGTALRKTSIGDNSLKPAMTFSAGQKVNGTTDKQDVKKDVKLELVGEWDPKNFVDKVPDSAALPSWKVHLQAKQIAEKTMKETLEQRKIDERESRFANMPAWKRAMVEKKEAETMAQELKKQQESEEGKQKTTSRRLPKITVTPKSANGEGGNLAPWQLELKNK